MSRNTSKRNSSRISSSSSAISAPAPAPQHDSEGAADVQTENEQRRTAIRQRRARENEIDEGNLDEQSRVPDPLDQGDDAELPRRTPPQGGGDLP